MDQIGKNELPGLFRRLSQTFAEQRTFLIELDGKVGDSDLGITMNKGFNAALDAVAANTTDKIGKTLQLAGMAIAKAAPSTMGTLTATGFMRGGKAIGEASAIGTAEMAAFWTAYRDGVEERGKAKVGNKTLLDVLHPIALSLQESTAAGVALSEAMEAAAQAAAAGLEATKTMVAQHGKAACFPEKSLGLQDAGATVGVLIINTLRAFVAEDKGVTP